jgi:5-aminopentanamidase
VLGRESLPECESRPGNRFGEGGRVFNSAALIDHGELRAVYRKAHLWDAERLVFDAGTGAPPVVATRHGRLGVVICYDLEFPEWVRLPALAGADLLCAPVNWPDSPRPAGERPAEVIRVQADAGMNRMFVAACDRTGTERGVAWIGGSVIADPDGWLLAGGTAIAGPAEVRAECRLAMARDKRVSRHSDVHADRRPELYRRLIDPGPP